MRIAAIYDIHGNLPALKAVLADIERAEPDLILVGGDVASGPMPRATLDRLMALGERARFIRGNGDRELVGYFDGDRRTSADAEDHVGRVLAWTAGQITHEQRDFLAQFPDYAVLKVDGLGSALFCHGSPRSDKETITAATPVDLVREMLSGVPQDLVVCGHTHMQFDRTIGAKRVLNAGSVGMAYQGAPGAYWLLLGPEVDFQCSTYDVDEAARQIRASGMPGADEFARENVLNSLTEAEATEFIEAMRQR